MPVARFTDGDVRRRQIHQHRGTGERREARWRQRHPHVLADLDMDLEQRQIARLEYQLRPERDSLAAQVDICRERAVGAVELPSLVELAVVRQVGLGHDAEQLATGHQRRAVEQAMVDAQWQPDDGHRGNVARCIDDLLQRDLAGFQQGGLVKKIVAGIGRESEFGERHQHRAVGGGLAIHRDGFGGIENRVGDAIARHRDGHPRESVGVGVQEGFERCGFGHDAHCLFEPFEAFGKPC